MSTAVTHSLLGTDERRALRAAAPVLAPILLIVTITAAIALSTSRAGLARVCDNVYWTVAYAGGAALAWLGARASAGSDRRARLWFAWALTTYAIGQVLWDIQVAIGWNPFPGPSDAFYILLGPLTGLGCIGLLTPAARRTSIFDSAGLSMAVLGCTLALYLPKRGGDVSLLQLSVLVAYPVVLCWAACTAMTAVLSLRLAPSLGLGLFGVGLVGNAALWLEWNRLTLDNALADGTLLNVLFAPGAIAQGLGVLLLRAERSSSARWERFCEGTLRLLPLSMVVVSATGIVLAFALPNVPTAVRWSALAGALPVVVIATLRQSLLLGEREQLIKVERELRKAEENFRVLVEQAADGIFIADTNGVYLDVNTRGADMLGMLRQEVIGKRISDVIEPSEAERVAPGLERLKRGETVNSSWLFRRKDGSTFHGEVTAKQLPDGRLQGFVRDASERLTLEAQLRQSQKMEAMGVLAAGIAHDFNNILTAIRGNASLVAQDIEPSHPAADSVADIERAAERATELVQRILAFSRPRPPAREQVALADLMQEVAKLLRPSLPAGIELKLELGQRTPLVSADPAQLHQVLMNLCTNAWQALGSSPGSIELTLTSRRLYGNDADLELPAGEYASITVSDTGPGMDQATLERIFEPFFTTKAPGEGTGLGLSVVHSIVRNHNGGLRVKSSPGHGSSFSLFFPAVAKSANLTERAEQGDRSSEPRLRQGKLRIVYVDDEPAVLGVVVKQLERRGYVVRGYASGAELLAALEAKAIDFDILVTDYNMPVMSGIELSRELKKTRPDIALVLTSGYMSDALRSAAEQLGISQLVKKPETIDRLCAAIEQAADEAERLALQA